MPEIGIFPLPLVLVPTERIPLHIFEPRYKELIGDCREHGAEFALLYSDGEGTREVGTTADVVEVLETLGRAAVFPIHPRTRAALEAAGLLGRAEAAATLTPPLGYLEFTALLLSAGVCLTDSGGVQKEAYLHSVPCITLRDTSEWVETIELGWNRLTGGLDAAAVATTLAGLELPATHPPLYGDGDASARIAEVVAASPLASWPP